MLAHGSYAVSSPEAGATPTPGENYVPPHKHWICRLIMFFVLCGIVLAVCLLSWQLTKVDAGDPGSKTEALQGPEGKVPAKSNKMVWNATTPSPAYDSTTGATTSGVGEDTDKLGWNTTPSPAYDSITGATTSGVGEDTDKLGWNTTPSPAYDSITGATTSGVGEDTDKLGWNTTPSPAYDSITGATTSGVGEDTDKLGWNTTPSPAYDSITGATTSGVGEDTDKLGWNTTPSPAYDSITGATTSGVGEDTDKLGWNTTPSSAYDSITGATTSGVGEDTDKLGWNTTPSPAYDSTTGATTSGVGEDIDKMGWNTTPSPAYDSTTGATTSGVGKDTDKLGWNTTPSPAYDSTTGATTSGVGEDTDKMGWNTTTVKPGNDIPSTPIRKQTSSRMLFFMNHEADVCNDFYEYACGGFEGNHLTIENDLAGQAIQRIFAQAEKAKNKGDSQLLKYFEDCMGYERKYNETQRIQRAEEAIHEIGDLATEGTDETKFNFTFMLSELLLRNSTPLFDIILDLVDVGNLSTQPRFMFRIVPRDYRSSLYVNDWGKCYNKQSSAMQEHEVDLRSLYEKYRECEADREDFLKSVEDAIKKFPVFKNDTDRQSVKNGISLILDNFPMRDSTDGFNGGPKKDKTRKNGLQLDWRGLVAGLTGSMAEDEDLRIYPSTKLLKKLDNLSKHKVLLNNALLGLYAHQIYNELVVPGRTEAYCRRAATSLMQRDASRLYMSSFRPEEHRQMNKMVKEMFAKLKETLKSGVENATWMNNLRSGVREKIDKMTIDIPDNKHYEQQDHIEPELTGNFFNDTMMLHKYNRNTTYGMWKKDVTAYEQIWTHFTLPYRTSSSVIYGLNKVIIPYAAVDWSVVRGAHNTSLDHLELATLGTLIAHGIGRHFDPKGVKYHYNRVSAGKIFSSNPNVQNAHDSYFNNHKSLAKINGSVTLPSTGQKIIYNVTDTSKNERVADNIGLQLAYDTVRSSELLPWLEKDLKKQFLLAYAQMHCTKEPITSSFVSLYEGESLPSRIRILELVSNNYQLLGQTWGCTKKRRDRGAPLVVEVFPDKVKNNPQSNINISKN